MAICQQFVRLSFDCPQSNFPFLPRMQTEIDLNECEHFLKAGESGSIRD